MPRRDALSAYLVCLRHIVACEQKVKTTIVNLGKASFVPTFDRSRGDCSREFAKNYQNLPQVPLIPSQSAQNLTIQSIRVVPGSSACAYVCRRERGGGEETREQTENRIFTIGGHPLKLENEALSGMRVQ